MLYNTIAILQKNKMRQNMEEKQPVALKNLPAKTKNSDNQWLVVARSQRTQGTEYSQNEQWEEAQASYEKALESLAKIPQQNWRHTHFLLSIECHIHLRETPWPPKENGPFIQKCFENVICILDKIIPSAPEKDNRRGQLLQARAQNNLGLIYYDQQNWLSAQHCFESAICALEKIAEPLRTDNDHKQWAYYYQNLGDCLSEQNQLHLAKEAFSNAMSQAQKTTLNVPAIIDRCSKSIAIINSQIQSESRAGQAPEPQEQKMTAQLTGIKQHRFFESISTSFPKLTAPPPSKRMCPGLGKENIPN